MFKVTVSAQVFENEDIFQYILTFLINNQYIDGRTTDYIPGNKTLMNMRCCHKAWNRFFFVRYFNAGLIQDRLWTCIVAFDSDAYYVIPEQKFLLEALLERAITKFVRRFAMIDVGDWKREVDCCARGIVRGESDPDAFFKSIDAMETVIARYQNTADGIDLMDLVVLAGKSSKFSASSMILKIFEVLDKTFFLAY